MDKENQIYELVVDDERGGIVDGAHTAKIIERCNAEQSTHEQQYVELYVRTGVRNGMVTDIARGLNTGMQVAPKSIYNIDGVFKWLKAEIAEEPYANSVAWRESDDADVDVRDLIGILEIFNVLDFPNNGNRHPISAYEKWSIPLKKFADDFEKHQEDYKKSTYHRLRPLLRDGLRLYDHIRRDFHPIHNQSGGRAGKMNIVEEGKGDRNLYFPFGNLDPAKYRLTKGASYPILGAFRNLVEVGPDGDVRWKGGFDSVIASWKSIAPELVEETFNATKEIGRTPDLLGKSRKHWDNLHMKVRIKMLEGQLAAQGA